MPVVDAGTCGGLSSCPCSSGGTYAQLRAACMQDGHCMHVLLRRPGVVQPGCMELSAQPNGQPKHVFALWRACINATEMFAMYHVLLCCPGARSCPTCPSSARAPPRRRCRPSRCADRSQHCHMPSDANGPAPYMRLHVLALMAASLPGAPCEHAWPHGCHAHA